MIASYLVFKERNETRDQGCIVATLCGQRVHKKFLIFCGKSQNRSLSSSFVADPKAGTGSYQPRDRNMYEVILECKRSEK